MCFDAVCSEAFAPLRSVLSKSTRKWKMGWQIQDKKKGKKIKMISWNLIQKKKLKCWRKWEITRLSLVGFSKMIFFFSWVPQVWLPTKSLVCFLVFSLYLVFLERIPFIVSKLPYSPKLKKKIKILRFEKRSGVVP